jgi:hypothetical protein
MGKSVPIRSLSQIECTRSGSGSPPFRGGHNLMNCLCLIAGSELAAYPVPPVDSTGHKVNFQVAYNSQGRVPTEKSVWSCEGVDSGGGRLRTRSDFVCGPQLICGDGRFILLALRLRT